MAGWGPSPQTTVATLCIRLSLVDCQRGVPWLQGSTNRASSLVAMGAGTQAGLACALQGVPPPMVVASPGHTEGKKGQAVLRDTAEPRSLEELS